MGYFHRYAEQIPAGAAEEGVVGTDIQIAVHKRAMIRRFDGWSLEAAPQNTRFYLNTTTAALVTGGAPAHVWGGAVAGIGNVGADMFYYVDALAAAVNLCASVQMSAGGGPACGAGFSGIFQ